VQRNKKELTTNPTYNSQKGNRGPGKQLGIRERGKHKNVGVKTKGSRERGGKKKKNQRR